MVALGARQASPREDFFPARFRAGHIGFQMRAYLDSEKAFPSYELCYSPGISVADIQRRNYPTFIGIDLAGDKRPGNVIFTLAMDPASLHRYPVEVACGDWKSPELARRLNDTHSRWPNTRHILVENNGVQQAIIDWLKQSAAGSAWWYKVESFTTGANKANPTIGLPSLELEFHHRMWSIPTSEYRHHSVTCQCGWCMWDLQMREYPLGAADDAVLGTWFAREALARWGPGARALPTAPSNNR